MTSARDIIVAPVVSEKSYALMEAGVYTFTVHPDASQPQIRDAVKNDQAVAEALGRMEAHLAANDVDLKRATLTLGPVLEMNPKTERFTNNEAANKLVTREYRKPYVVPEKV